MPNLAIHIAPNSFYIFKLLLSRGADINAPLPVIDSGRTALQAAVRNAGRHVPNGLVIVQQHLNLRANVNDPAAEVFGRTVLHIASDSGNIEFDNGIGPWC